MARSKPPYGLAPRFVEPHTFDMNTETKRPPSARLVARMSFKPRCEQCGAEPSPGGGELCWACGWEPTRRLFVASNPPPDADFIQGWSGLARRVA